MLTSLAAADPLVRAVTTGGPLSAEAAARELLALASGPPSLARAILDRVVDDDARLVWRAGELVLAPAPWADMRLEAGRYSVIDIETTGLSPDSDTICEAAAVRVEQGRATRTVELRVTARRSPERVAALLLEAAGDAVVVGHNVRFDLLFIDRALARSQGARVASPVLDTLVLARRLLAGRTRSFSLAALAGFLGAGTAPCHRALPDALATAEILLHLLELARERGAATVGDLCAWGRPRSQARADPP